MCTGTVNNYTSKLYMFGRLFDKLLFAIFGIAYYWHVGKDLSASNALNIEGFLFMWCAPQGPPTTSDTHRRPALQHLLEFRG